MKRRSVADTYVLDSFAVLAHLGDEDSSGRVADILKAARGRKVKLFMSVVNFGEIYYISMRERGREKAEDAKRMIEQLPIKVVDADRELTLEAARLKAIYPVAYADCYAAALGLLRKAPVVTGDPEFRKFGEVVMVEWL